MKAAALTLAALLSVPALSASAQNADAPDLSTIIAGLEADGYRVHEVDVDRDEIDIEAVDRDQRRVELRLDPRTGDILNEAADD